LPVKVPWADRINIDGATGVERPINPFPTISTVPTSAARRAVRTELTHMDRADQVGRDDLLAFVARRCFNQNTVLRPSPRCWNSYLMPRYPKYATTVIGAHSVPDWYEALDRLVSVGQSMT
jgi:hypothetical protein